MAAVTIRTGPVSAADKARDVDPSRWKELTRARRSFVAVKVQYDCRSLIGFVDEAEQFRIWEKTGHADLTDYIRNGLEIDPELVEWARIGLESLDRTKPQPLKVAVESGKKTAAEALADAPNNAPRRGDIGVGRPNRSDNITPKQRGTNQSYIAARIKRDHPDIAARIEAGEFRSINAAALEAGIRKPHKSIPIDSAQSAIRALGRVFSDAELVEAVNCLCTTQAGRA